MNLYAYCFNNPHSWIDPLGLCAYNKFSDWVHGGLAALGLIPVLGIVPDLIDAGLYLLEGNLLDAGIAGVAAIPAIGQLTRGGEYLYKFGKYLLKSDKLNDLFRSGWKLIDNNIGAVGDVGSLKKGAKKRGPKGGIKHKPGRGHDSKSAPQKQKRFQKKAADKKATQQAEYDAAKQKWDSLTTEQKKLLPELNPNG